MNNEFDSIRAAAAQQAFCDRNEVPMFAPSDGICYRCKRNIYMQRSGKNDRIYGISVEKAGHNLITACPHCYCSFLE